MLLMVRHGQTKTNASGRLLGRADPPLDEVGVGQAEALAAALGRPYRVVASPLLRARQTAAMLGGHDIDAVDVDDRFVELNYGDLEGRRMSEVSPETWAAWQSDPAWAPPGGESLDHLALRVFPALHELVAEARDNDIVVVSHVSPIKASMAWALGSGIEISWRSHLNTASITRIGIRGSTPLLYGFNDVSHLGTGQW